MKIPLVLGGIGCMIGLNCTRVATWDSYIK
jgi:hypothetical protein